MDLLRNGPARARRHLVLAHGAGAAMDSPFMNAIAEGVAAQGVRVTRFEFPYMQERRRSGRKRGPDRQAVLIDTWKRVVEQVAPPAQLFIGGKSMGGRIASMIADELGVKGLICLGYPFHPPGKPANTRIAHLEHLKTPALILQGTRDSLGTRQDVDGYALSKAIHVQWLEDGDHSFKPRVKSGRSLDQALQEAVTATAEFMK